MEKELIKIAVCDDDIRICSDIENAILEYGNGMQEIFYVEVYYTGAALCNDLDNGEVYDILFLDIVLANSSSGVSIGHYIREKEKNEVLQIVYISSHKNYALELFKVRPVDFLIKPIAEKVIWKTLQLCTRLLQKAEVSFQYKQGRNLNKIPIKDILYFKSNDREVEMMTTNGRKTFYGSLENIYDQLSIYRFFYAHKSYLVNYMHVTEFFYDRICISNNDIIIIAQNRRKQVREIQKNYLYLETENVD
ncbi:response regulator transcription factor [Clostridium sp. WB02_MRS01]|uniref:LytR/AlgR family response regulator transcription factor n=1 Tax=Clostridium sp. WB02_MRS01 TaxID=2605777 RepID=UPI0012B2E18A|nr:LytTR family DNA-binding domain-containing protein [Clostridium sp. WB02_MRS01]MSS07205.1 response regulator transcription factor [Clostridium sp. WB02_MRS01]